MTDAELLWLIRRYYAEQSDVALCMIGAMNYFESGKEQISFAYLFDWCEAKDRRDELWEQFKHQYPRAVMLKEGVSYGKD